MNITGVLLAVAVVGGVGLFIGLFLGIAAIKFKVEVDEKEEAVLTQLGLKRNDSYYTEEN